MQIVERSYSSDVFRPKPLLHWDLDQRFLMIVTNWGSAESAQKIIQDFTKYVLAAQGDVEVTTPFEFLPQLTPEANSLRIASQLTNELIFRSENKSELTAGVELCALLHSKNQLAWLQIGLPSILIKRSHKMLEPLSIAHDLSSQFSQEGRSLHPLPQSLLGTEPILNPQVGSLLLQNQDQIFLLSRSHLSASVFNQPHLPAMVQALSEDSDKEPFWLAQVTVE